MITLLTCLVLAACGTASREATPPDVPEGRSGVILEIRDEGGFAPIQASLTRIPRFVVFADGSVVRHEPGAAGPGDGGFPLFQSRLPDADFTDILTYLDDLGLADEDRVDVNEALNVADASTTVLTMYDGNGAHRLGVYALGFEDPTDPRAAILSSMIDLLDAATTAVDGEVYEPPAYEVLVTSDVVDNGLQVQPRWPLDTPPDDLEELGIGPWRCVVVGSSEIGPALTEQRDGASSSVWSYEGAEYLVLTVPLFPHEDGC